MLGRLARICAAAAALITVADAQAEPLQGRYFGVVWGYQGASHAPEDAHTFASFYRGDDLARGAVKPLTISWLPASGVIRSGTQEQGRNFGLQETLAIARSRGYQLASYGPYEIRPELYQRAAERASELDSGRWRYSMLNGAPGAINCIAALGGIAGPINTAFDYGFTASQDVVAHMSKWMPHYPRTDVSVRAQLSEGIRRTWQAAGQRASNYPSEPAVR